MDSTLDRKSVETLVRTATETLAELALCDQEPALNQATQAIARILRSKDPIEPVLPLPAGTHIIGNASVPRLSNRVLGRTPHGISILCWVTHELPWIYPDDPRLWDLLNRARTARARPLIIARKVAPVTFPFLKSLGAYALQYHLPLLPSKISRDLPRRVDQFGWPPIAVNPSLRRHPIIGYTREFVAQTAIAEWILPTGVAELIDDAISRGFLRGRSISTEAMTGWASACPGLIPSRWVSSIGSWAASWAPAAGQALDEEELPAVSDVSDVPPTSDTGHPEVAPPRTVVTHGLVAADVDKDTWEQALSKIGANAHVVTSRLTTHSPFRVGGRRGPNKGQ
jgi:hypothetical protein